MKKTTINSDVQALLALIDVFGVLLENETKALKAADFKAVDALQPEKRVLATRYGEMAETLNARKDEASALDPALRAALIKKRTGFTQILSANLHTLEATKNGARRLIDRILESAQKAAIDRRQTHYSAKGNTGSWRTATMSLSVDQQL